MKKKKKEKKLSVQELLGIKSFTPYGILTRQGEMLLFEIAPSNLSVLPRDVVAEKIRQLTVVLSALPGLEICCLDAAECFDDNLAYMDKLITEEESERVQTMLQNDMKHLEHLQAEVATDRQFVFIMRCKGMKQELIFSRLNEVQRIVAEQGFTVRHLKKPDIKRLLGLYLGTARDGEQIADVDGELYVRDGFLRHKREKTEEEKELDHTKSFFDCISPGVIKFMSDRYLVGDQHRCVWVLRGYPPSTNDLAIFSHMTDNAGVTLHIYNRLVEGVEQHKIVQNAVRRNKLKAGDNDVTTAVEGQGNLQDVVQLLADLRQNREPLLHSAVFIELRASTEEKLEELMGNMDIALAQARFTVDKLTLRQKEGFLSVMPLGSDQFGSEYERVLPAGSVANFYPFGYSGKLDPHGFLIGKEKYGAQIVLDLDARTEDKTNSNVLILGNSGQGKSFLMKLLLTAARESGKNIIILDAEREYRPIIEELDGYYIDCGTGEYIINPLEPRIWDAQDNDSTERKPPQRSQHIAFLKDFFRTYRDFDDAQLATIEIMLTRLYDDYGITEAVDLSTLDSTDYPTLSDLYALCEKSYMNFNQETKHLYTEDTLQAVCLGLHSMCVGSESKYFNGQTNIISDRAICFGVADLMNSNKRLLDTVLFNLLAYMSGKMLNEGNTVAAIDELYLFFNNLTSVEYIRNIMKRDRKRDSSLIVASQNVNDFFINSLMEFTKSVFSIPSLQFLFNPGTVKEREYRDALQLEEQEYHLIKTAPKRTCLCRCGTERFYMEITAPEHKKEIIERTGGR